MLARLEDKRKKSFSVLYEFSSEISVKKDNILNGEFLSRSKSHNEKFPYKAPPTISSENGEARQDEILIKFPCV